MTLDEGIRVAQWSGRAAEDECENGDDDRHKRGPVPPATTRTATPKRDVGEHQSKGDEEGEDIGRMRDDDEKDGKQYDSHPHDAPANPATTHEPLRR